MQPTDLRSSGGTDHVILVATTRARAADTTTLFTGERGQSLDFAEVTVSVPPVHVADKIEWPDQPPGDPAKDFVTRSATYLDGQAGFTRALKSELAKRPAGQRDIVLFVHGYNTLFAEGLYRFAQLTHDANGHAVPVLFSWASRGMAPQYLYDLNSATAARDALQVTLRQLAASGADHIIILAHSMGNWPIVEALRELRIAGEHAVDDKISLVALASPDIDYDVFKSQMKRYGKTRQPFVVILSRDDHALELSTQIAGNKLRVGDFENDAELAGLGVYVVDLSELKGEDDFNHSKFVQMSSYAAKVREILKNSGVKIPADLGPPPASAAQQLQTGLGGIVTSAASVVVAVPQAVIGK